MFFVDLNVFAVDGRPKIAQAMPVKELSLKLLPPHDYDHSHHEHHHQHAAQTTTRAPYTTRMTTETPYTTRRPVTGGNHNHVETLNYEFVQLPNGYRYS